MTDDHFVTVVLRMAETDVEALRADFDERERLGYRTQVVLGLKDAGLNSLAQYDATIHSIGSLPDEESS